MSRLDVLRGAYVRAPGWVRRSLSGALALVPVNVRLGATFNDWSRRIAELEADPARRTAEVESRLQELLTYARARSPYWAHRLSGVADVGLTPASSDWRGIPILTKDDLRTNGTSMLTCPADDFDEVTTSGSSGEPLRFFLDRNRSAAEFAFVANAWGRAGFMAGMRRAVFRGVAIDGVSARPYEYDPALAELRCSAFHMHSEALEQYREEIVLRRIAYLHGYPSALCIFARHLIVTGIAPMTQIRGLFPVSEPLYDHQRALLAQVFPSAMVVPFYGLSEKVAFAIEVVDRPGQYIFNSVYGIAELINQAGEPVQSPGERGRIVGTGLLCRGMPFIRYDTQDEATLVEPATRRNGWSLVVEDISPRRSTEYLVSRSGALISMTAINIHSSAYASVHSFQLCQAVPGKAVFRAVLSRPDAIDGVRRLVQEIEAKTGGEVQFAMEICDSLPTSGRGKRKFIEQSLPISEPGT